MKIRHIGLAAAIMLGLGMGAAHAGTYIGVSAGQVSTSDWLSRDDAAWIFQDAFGTVPTWSDARDSGKGFKVYVGLPVGDSFDVRIGYAYLGDFRAGASNGTGRLEFSHTTHAIFADIVAKLRPHEKIALFGKLGGVLALNELAIEGQGPGGFAQHSEQGNSLVLAPGLGISVDITSSVGLTVEYERYFDVGDENTGEGDINLVSAGLYFRF